MIVLNFFAGPGCGKSTSAAGLFFLMKQKNYKVELVTEYAKAMTYEKRHNILSDQLYILAKQNRSLIRVQNDVDFVITDSPLLLGLVYTRQDYYENFRPLVFEIFNSYQNENFLLRRVKAYQEYGRSQTLEQAREKDQQVLDILERNKVVYQEIDGDSNAPQTILDYIENKYGTS